ncbi:putative glucose-1-phosphate adenylyltransferase large subunit 2, chloroplastic-like [Capsicum annuum]|nr:putative glucose-1-phosphate adenylyltransferase large subunit 2, chloroplastic-like [Capsicum annuum]
MSPNPLTTSDYMGAPKATFHALHLLLHLPLFQKVLRVSQADVNTQIIFNCQMGRGRTTTGMVIATLVYLNRIGASDDASREKRHKAIEGSLRVSSVLLKQSYEKTSILRRMSLGQIDGEPRGEGLMREDTDFRYKAHVALEWESGYGDLGFALCREMTMEKHVVLEGGWKRIPRSNSIGRVSDCLSNLNDTLANSEEAIRRGEYTVIRSLIRVLEGGVEGKRQVDKVIDKCSSMQNLREAIAIYRNSILRQPDEMKKEAALSFFVEYLERYYFLICFAVYLHTQRDALFAGSSAHCSFSDWMKARPELYSIIRRLLRRDPMGALGYASLEPSRAKLVDSADNRPSEMGQVAALRNGEVLGPQTVLKSDHCPGCQHPGLPEILEGAPNFREIPGFPVYGVANPTVSGIRSVIQRIGSSKGGRPVFWHNMREEPVIYINGKPFVLREVERPYKNMLEYTGIDRERVEKMEARLKDDIMREADRYHGAIMVIHETDDGQIFDAWEHVSSDAVQTPVEVFKCLEADGFPIKYARVPITDGKAPKSSDFDVLSSNIASASKDTAFVFNCQMGIGRTTTGTVTACLLKLRIDHGRPIRVLHDASNPDLGGGMSSDDESEGQLNPPASLVLKSRPQTHTNDAFGINDILLLWKITRLFDNGVECREALDAIIDRCSALQNIRQAVLQYRKLFNQQHNEPRERRVALNRGAEYLERYFRLIAFAAYLGSEAFDGFCGQGESRMTFKDWLHQRPEVQAMKWSIRLRPGRFFTIPEELRAPHESQHGDAVMEAIVKDRNGSVLGKGSILKMYFFPGQRTSSHIQIHGAPHVYRVDGYPIYSMATPTIAGAKEMLSYLGAKQTSKEKIAKRVILTDLREEAVVYINGTPFVLRELNKPVESLKHVGITGPLVEHLEARLKDDIQCEIRQSGGRMLLHREEYNPTSNQVSIIGYWENIFVDDVKTPAEVYASLKCEGYDITYRRIPLTREKEALSSDIDAIQYCKDDSAGAYLFVSHTGFGGIAYAMAIICLRLEAEAKLSLDIQRPFGSTGLPCSSVENFDVQISDDEAGRMGDYRDILSLTRVLVHGPESKTHVDAVIERKGCGLPSIALSDSVTTLVKDSEMVEEVDHVFHMKGRILILVNGNPSGLLGRSRHLAEDSLSPMLFILFLSIFQRCAGAGHLGEDIVQYSQELERKLDEDEERRAYVMDMGIRALRRYFFLITFRSYLYSSSPAEMIFSEWMDARPELGHLLTVEMICSGGGNGRWTLTTMVVVVVMVEMIGVMVSVMMVPIDSGGDGCDGEVDSLVVMVDSDGGVAAVIVTVVVTMDIFIMIEVACVIAVDSTKASRRYRSVRKPLYLDVSTTNKTRTSRARVKVQLDLMAERHQYMIMEIENELTKEKRSIKVKIKYDMILTYCTKYSLQGHEMEECRVFHPELRQVVEKPTEDNQQNHTQPQQNKRGIAKKKKEIRENSADMEGITDEGNNQVVIHMQGQKNKSLNRLVMVQNTFPTNEREERHLSCSKQIATTYNSLVMIDISLDVDETIRWRNNKRNNILRNMLTHNIGKVQIVAQLKDGNNQSTSQLADAELKDVDLSPRDLNLIKYAKKGKKQGTGEANLPSRTQPRKNKGSQKTKNS